MESIRNTNWFETHLKNKNILSKCLKINGLMIKHAPEELRNSLEIGLEAVDQNGKA
jgi:hypothetical protein